MSEVLFVPPVYNGHANIVRFGTSRLNLARKRQLRRQLKALLTVNDFYTAPNVVERNRVLF